jgi:hypothetical protein
MMTELEQRLGARDIAFNASDRKIACYGHVIDLTSGRVIDSVTKAGDEEDVPPPSNSNAQQTYDEAVARDPIALARNVVRVIRASGAR